MSSKVAKKRTQKMGEDEEVIAAKLFSNRVFSARASESDESDNDIEHSNGEDVAIVSKSVWHDEDDDELEQIVVKKNKTTNYLRRTTDNNDPIPRMELQERLRVAFAKTSSKGKQPKWARTRETHLDDEADMLVRDFMRTAGRYVADKSAITKEIIRTRLLQDIAIGHTETRPVNILRFHKVKPVLIVASDSGSVRLFKVDSEVKKDHFLQKVLISRFPITSCELLKNASELLLGSRSAPYFMKYNMETNELTQIRIPQEIPKQNCGRFRLSDDGTVLALIGFRGQVYILMTSTFDYSHKFSFPAEVASIQFFPESNNELWVLTENGQIFICNISSKKQDSFFNDGAVHGTSLLISPDGQYLAVGENTGYVNVYDTIAARNNKNAKPRFSVSNLLTSIGSMAFTFDSRILAIASPLQKNQVRLVNISAEQVFQNFPHRTEKLEYVLSLDFSPHGGYFGIGLKSGGISLHRVEYFDTY